MRTKWATWASIACCAPRRAEQGCAGPRRARPGEAVGDSPPGARAGAGTPAPRCGICSDAYLDPDRPGAGGDPRPYAEGRNCTTYDDWPYGLQNRRGYAARLADDQLRRQLAERPVTYLLGELDTLPLANFDASCRPWLRARVVSRGARRSSATSRKGTARGTGWPSCRCAATTPVACSPPSARPRSCSRSPDRPPRRRVRVGLSWHCRHLPCSWYGDSRAVTSARAVANVTPDREAELRKPAARSPSAPASKRSGMHF